MGTLGYWTIEVAGTFLCIAALINILLGRTDYLLYLGAFVLGLVIILAGFPLRPKVTAGIP